MERPGGIETERNSSPYLSVIGSYCFAIVLAGLPYGHRISVRKSRNFDPNDVCLMWHSAQPSNAPLTISSKPISACHFFVIRTRTVRRELQRPLFASRKHTCCSQTSESDGSMMVSETCASYYSVVQTRTKEVVVPHTFMCYAQTTGSDESTQVIQ